MSTTVKDAAASMQRHLDSAVLTLSWDQVLVLVCLQCGHDAPDVYFESPYTTLTALRSMELLTFSAPHDPDRFPHYPALTPKDRFPHYPVLTPKAKKYLDMLRSTPLPVEQWVDPRTS